MENKNQSVRVAENIEYMRGKVENLEKAVDELRKISERQVIISERQISLSQMMAEYRDRNDNRVLKIEEDVAEQKKFMFKCIGGAILLSALLSGLVAVTRLSDFVA